MNWEGIPHHSTLDPLGGSLRDPTLEGLQLLKVFEPH